MCLYGFQSSTSQMNVPQSNLWPTKLIGQLQPGLLSILVAYQRHLLSFDRILVGIIYCMMGRMASVARNLSETLKKTHRLAQKIIKMFQNLEQEILRRSFQFSFGKILLPESNILQNVIFRPTKILNSSVSMETVDILLCKVEYINKTYLGHSMN